MKIIFRIILREICEIMIVVLKIIHKNDFFFKKLHFKIFL